MSADQEFKLGDKVRVRSAKKLEADFPNMNYGPVIFKKSMKQYCSRKAEVVGIGHNLYSNGENLGTYYYLAFPNCPTCTNELFSADILELILPTLGPEYLEELIYEV